MNLAKRILGSWHDIWLVRVTFEIFFIILPIAFFIRTIGFGLYQVPTGSMETTLLVGERFFADKVTYWFRKPQRGDIISFNAPNFKYSQNKLTNLGQRYVSWNVVNWTKRVIGIPGDRVKGVIEDGHPVIYLNGKKLDESAYVNKYPLIRLHVLPGEEWKGWIALRTFMRRIPFISWLITPPYHYDQVQRSYVPGVPYDEQPFYKINPHEIVLNKQGEPKGLVYPGTPLKSGADIFDRVLGENQYWVMGDNRLGSDDSRSWGPLDGSLIHGRIVFRVLSMDTDYSWLLWDLICNPIGFWKKIRWSRSFQFVH